MSALMVAPHSGPAAGARSATYTPVHLAAVALAAGSVVVLHDDREPRGAVYLVANAAHATAETTAFLVRYSSGLLEVGLLPARAQDLAIGAQSPRVNDAQRPCDQLVTVDAVGAGTGISASARSMTIRTLADPRSRAEQLSRPGHVMIRRVDLGRDPSVMGASEIAYLLAVAGGAGGVNVHASMTSESDYCAMADLREAAEFAASNGLPIASFSAVAAVMAADSIYLCLGPE